MGSKQEVSKRKGCPNCGNHYWESTIEWVDGTFEPAWECTNCLLTEARRVNARPTQDSEITASQRRAADRLRRYFETEHIATDGIAKYEEEVISGGQLCVTIETKGNVFTSDYALVFIGRRGRITFKMFRSGVSGKEHSDLMGGFAARFVGGHYEPTV